jgi:hypothetical protein
VTIPDVNQFENSTGVTVHAALASLGTTVCATATGLKNTNAVVASDNGMFVPLGVRRRLDRRDELKMLMTSPFA